MKIKLFHYTISKNKLIQNHHFCICSNVIIAFCMKILRKSNNFIIIVTMILIIIKHEFLVARVVTGMDRPTWKPHSVITCASHSGCSDSETTETRTMNQRRSKKNQTRMNQRVIRAEHALCHCVVRNKESDQLLKIKNLINLPPNRSKLVAAQTSLRQGE